MAVVVTKVTGIGGSPPAQLLVEGTVTNCEKVYVSITCATDPALPLDVQGLPFDPVTQERLWSFVFPNDKGCLCGGNVKVHASCVLGMPDASTTTFDLPIICSPPGCCDEVMIAPPSVPCLPLDGSPVTGTFSATLAPAGCTGPFEWQVSNYATNAVLHPYAAGTSTFSYAFTAPGTYKVNVRVQQSATCDDPVLTDSVLAVVVPCTTCQVRITGPAVLPCTDGPPTAPQTFVANATPAFAGQYSWEVEDGTGATVHQSAGGTTLAYAFPGPGTYKVKVSVATAGCTTPTVSDTVTVTIRPCKHRPPPHDVTPPVTLPPVTTPPVTTPPVTTPPVTTPPVTTPPVTPPAGGYPGCCVLIVLWGALHVVGGTLLYFAAWYGALGVGIAAGIALGIWVGVCCWPCALTIWKCCAFLQWQWIFNSILSSTLFGLFAIGQAGNGIVVGAFAAVTAAVLVMMGNAGCAVPNPLWPPSWPWATCKCP